MAQDIAELGAAIGSSVGEVRTENQDRAVIARFSRLPGISSDNESSLLFVLCDGMGGLPNGARCAETAIASFIGSLVYSESNNRRADLHDAVNKANREVYRSFKGRGGTTIAAVLLSRQQLLACSVGDSRIYTVENKRVRQISRDDTIAGEVSRAKGVDIADLQLGHIGFGLAQFIGMGEGIEPRTYEVALASDQLSFCLTSDGAHSITPSVFDKVVGMAPNPYASVTRLLQLSRWCGGVDNATAVFGTLDLNTAGGIALANVSGVELWDSHSKLELSFAVYSEDSIKGSSSLAPSSSPEPAAVAFVKQESAGYVQKGLKKKRKRDRSSNAKGVTNDETAGQATLEIEIKPGVPASSAVTSSQVPSSQHDEALLENPLESGPDIETREPPEGDPR